MSFEFGEGHFDRIEIGAVGRQKQEPAATLAQCFGGALALVCGQVVEDHDGSGIKRRGQLRLDVGVEGGTVHSPFDHPRRDQGVLRQSSDEGLRAPFAEFYHQNEVEQSTYNFEHSDVSFLLGALAAHERQAQHLMAQQLALPAYEQVLKAAHTFNLLDARGAISVTERAAYIGRIRNLARSVAQSYLDSRLRLGFPMAPRAWAEEVMAEQARHAA